MDYLEPATWRGGPWDGLTIDVVRAESHFPVYVPTMRLCPVVRNSEGRLVINWDESKVPDRLHGEMPGHAPGRL